MGFGNILRNLRDRGLTDVLDPEVRAVYGEWKTIKKNGLHLDAEELPSYAEQFVWRTKVCEPCVKNGECLHCHCPTIPKMSVPLSKCSDGKWGPMKTSEDWEKQKEEENIQLLLIQ